MKKERKREKVRIVSSYILIVLTGIILGIYVYLQTKFKQVTVEQMLYNVFYSEGASFNAISEGLLYVIVITLVFCFFALFPLYIGFFSKVVFCFKWRNRKRKINILPLSGKVSLLYSGFLFALTAFLFCYSFGFFEYMYYQFNDTKIFDDYYVNPKQVNISGENKKNIIYIFGESFETTNLSIENGGAKLDSYMPNLEKLALENINFSNGEKLGGAIQFDGLGWTVAGMVAQTSGVPLKIKIDGNSYKEYSSFLPGVYSMGEILEDKGYKNYIMMGSDSSFGGRNEYFKQHGNYEIFDYNWAVENKKVSKDYYVWWGFEDNKLFSFAKDKLIEISKKNEPFNFTLLTADTHFPNGYVDSSCSSVFDINYANSIYCSDGMIYNFVRWIQKQDFYEDTVIVIVGDHLTMQTDLYNDIDSNYKRNVYNVIINSDLEITNNKNRMFTTMDIYPTIIASMGYKIEGDRLGLGTNLFSERKTIVEELGLEKFDIEIKKRSKFYDNYLLGDSYKEMLKDVVKNDG